MTFPSNAAMDSIAVSWHLRDQEANSVETNVKIVNVSFSRPNEEEMQIKHMSDVLYFLSFQPFTLRFFFMTFHGIIFFYQSYLVLLKYLAVFDGYFFAY